MSNTPDFADALYGSQLKDRLRAVGEIGTLFQLIRWDEIENHYEHIDLYHIGTLISDTIKETFELMDDIGRQEAEERKERVQLAGPTEQDIQNQHWTTITRTMYDDHAFTKILGEVLKDGRKLDALKGALKAIEQAEGLERQEGGND